LSLDWDPRELRLLEGRWKGNALTVERALRQAEPFPATTADAEAAGRRLRDVIKQSGFAALPLLIGVPRDRLVFRDIRHPDVPAEELPSIVQFQALKELTLPIEDVVIDFARVGVPWPTGEQRALTAVLRKEVLTLYERFANGAGLKLAGLTPRAYALEANWSTLFGGATGQTVAAVVAAGEMSVVRGRDVLFSRHLDPDEPLGRELRRSLAAYNSQFPRHAIQEIYLADEALPLDFESVVESLRLPVRLYDPLAGVNLAAGVQPHTELAAAVGLLQARMRSPELPVNFLAPKKDIPKPNRARRYALIGGAAAAALLLLVSGSYLYASSERASRIAELQADIAAKKKQLDTFADVEKRLDAVHAWAGSEVVVLDELYDLIARFPDVSGLRVTKAVWEPAVAGLGASSRPGPAGTAKPGAPARTIKPVSQLTLELAADSSSALDEFHAALDAVRHWDVDRWERIPRNPGDMRGPNNEVKVVLKIFAQSPEEYRAVLGASSHTTQPGDGGQDRRRGRFRGGRP
jgi:hypothetical protein